jgi:hypothetical protein
MIGDPQSTTILCHPILMEETGIGNALNVELPIFLTVPLVLKEIAAQPDQEVEEEPVEDLMAKEERSNHLLMGGTVRVELRIFKIEPLAFVKLVDYLVKMEMPMVEAVEVMLEVLVGAAVIKLMEMLGEEPRAELCWKILGKLTK